ncbi:MAG: disulfide bond formation protein DsbA [Candidatus Nanopelagicales bacterium]
MTTTADFYIDPMSPWAWVTARWLEEVTGLRDVQVNWQVMCLDILHEGDELPESYAAWLKATWKAPRAIEAARAAAGDDAARRLLFAIGRLTNVERNRDIDAVIAMAVAECGLPDSVAAAAESTEFDAAVRASHDEAMALGGKDVGTPILAIPGPDGTRVGLFGPVVTPTPRGEAAGKLWDGLLLLAATPGFYELKKERKAKVWCD